MGIFTRVRDIISSNINTMLDKAEDPEKLVRLMIQEMEDTLVEIKASTAGAMATRKKIERNLAAVVERASQWENRAELAVAKGREELAREALYEKRRCNERLASLETEKEQCLGLIAQYQEDIGQLEDKLAAVREKQRMLIQRHIHAGNKKRAQGHIRKVDTTDAFARFQGFESRIDRMEAEADLVNFGAKPTLDDEFVRLENDEDIEKELSELKSRTKKDSGA
jgi:phage shock protein A